MLFLDLAVPMGFFFLSLGTSKAELLGTESCSGRREPIILATLGRCLSSWTCFALGCGHAHCDKAPVQGRAKDFRLLVQNGKLAPRALWKTGVGRLQ